MVDMLALLTGRMVRGFSPRDTCLTWTESHWSACSFLLADRMVLARIANKIYRQFSGVSMAFMIAIIFLADGASSSYVQVQVNRLRWYLDRISEKM
jgi:hypothetical protein